MNVAVLFPGQGSQYAGMGKELKDAFPEIKDVFQQADDVLGFSLSRFLEYGEEEDLRKTSITQPAILTMGIASFRLIMENSDITTEFMAGHSVGEYTALVASGAMEFPDALRVVRERGMAMESCLKHGNGKMAAIFGLNSHEVEYICNELQDEGEVVMISNYNAPTQIVVSGLNKGVDRAIELSLKRGAARAIPLNVGAPFHSNLMKKADQRMSEVLENITIKEPKYPVISNVHAKPYPLALHIKDLLVQQIYSPVRWVESIRYIISNGINHMLEMAPGKVLCALVKRIEKGSYLFNFKDNSIQENFLTMNHEPWTMNHEPWTMNHEP